VVIKHLLEKIEELQKEIQELKSKWYLYVKWENYIVKYRT
jgi:hypothetical protein